MKYELLKYLPVVLGPLLFIWIFTDADDGLWNRYYDWKKRRARQKEHRLFERDFRRWRKVWTKNDGKSPLTKAQIKCFNYMLICPDCGTANKFLAGPCGGASQNILCSVCKSEFNYAPPFTPERIGSRSTEVRKHIYGV